MKDTRTIPILVDNSLNRAMAVKYALFSLFGLAGAITRLPTVSEFIGNGLASFTSIVVCVSAAIAAIGAWHSSVSLSWEKVELYSVIVFISFSMIWVFASIWLFVIGKEDRLVSVTLSVALLVMPIWRIRYLIKKNREP